MIELSKFNVKNGTNLYIILTRCVTKSLNCIPGRCPLCTSRSTVVMLELPFESILRWVEEKETVIQLSEHVNSKSYSPHQTHTLMMLPFLTAMVIEILNLIATVKESMG